MSQIINRCEVGWKWGVAACWSLLNSRHLKEWCCWGKDEESSVKTVKVRTRWVSITHHVMPTETDAQGCWLQRLLLDTELSTLISFASFSCNMFILKQLNQVNHIKQNPTRADRICQQQLSFQLAKTMIAVWKSEACFCLFVKIRRPTVDKDKQQILGHGSMDYFTCGITIGSVTNCS